jgi:hypothetical protein
MLLRRPSDAPVSRGQALVETALLLPVLALLLVMAIDFGRVFFGWVALQNAARIGADFAAGTADAWNGMPAAKADDRDRYAELIEADVEAINCALDGGVPPDPEFEDGADTGSSDTGDYDDGDYAVVDLGCSFSLITPLAEGVFGGPISMAAHEVFPIHRVITVGVPDPPTLPGCPTGEAEVPEMTDGNTMAQARDEWVAAGFDEDNFDPPTGVVSSGPPSGRNANKIVVNQDLEKHECQPEDAVVDVEHLP